MEEKKSQNFKSPNTSLFTSSRVSDRNLLENRTNNNMTEENSENIDLNEFYIVVKLIGRSDFKINMSTELRMTVLQIKEKLFDRIFLENNTVRIICQGKVLEDDKVFQIDEMKQDQYLHCFVSQKMERKNTVVTEISFTNDPQRLSLPQGFETFRGFNVNPNIILLQKISFHSQNILGQEIKDLNQVYFLEKEEEWVKDNLLNLSERENFFQEQKFKIFQFGNIQRIIGNFLGIIIGLFFPFVSYLLVFLHPKILILGEGIVYGSILWLIKYLVYSQEVQFLINDQK